jgi:flavin-dependent dehydrogenase
MLDKMKGHGYIGFDPNQLTACQADNVFLIGDALGLAQPMTGEGILPAVLSGKLCATAIAAGTPESYVERLRTHPIISDYRILHAIQIRVKKIFKDAGSEHHLKSGLLDRLIVIVFALLFSGKRIPGSHIIAKMRK